MARPPRLVASTAIRRFVTFPHTYTRPQTRLSQPHLRNNNSVLDTHTSPLARTIHTTSQLRAVGPEHPNYIDLPSTRQTQSQRVERIRGSLPTPRDLFSRRRGGFSRVTPESIARSIPLPASVGLTESERAARLATTPAEHVNRNAWKERMAALRRLNLEQGLNKMAGRRRGALKHSEMRRVKHTKERQALVDAPPKDYDALTRTTVPAVMLAPFQRKNSPGGALPDPTRAERIARMAANVAAKESAAADGRKDALHNLYMSARTFVVKEEQLDAMIDTVFGTEAQPKVFGMRGTSVWSQDVPESIQTKLALASGGAVENVGRNTLKGQRDSVGELARRRLQRVAEELTGGKI